MRTIKLIKYAQFLGLKVINEEVLGLWCFDNEEYIVSKNENIRMLTQYVLRAGLVQDTNYGELCDYPRMWITVEKCNFEEQLSIVTKFSTIDPKIKTYLSY
ncbi:hypothetical protein ACIQVU_07880 [Lysinibacillus sp. NPDC098008]|uniref:hypothetical protein n=1 Tax=Lysinibacillus sp. NPDC098008 TaxID=3364146 RepID=UPI0037F55C49